MKYEGNKKDQLSFYQSLLGLIRYWIFSFSPWWLIAVPLFSDLSPPGTSLWHRNQPIRFMNDPVRDHDPKGNHWETFTYSRMEEWHQITRCTWAWDSLDATMVTDNVYWLASGWQVHQILQTTHAASGSAFHSCSLQVFIASFSSERNQNLNDKLTASQCVKETENFSTYSEFLAKINALWQFKQGRHFRPLSSVRAHFCGVLKISLRITRILSGLKNISN